MLGFVDFLVYDLCWILCSGSELILEMLVVLSYEIESGFEIQCIIEINDNYFFMIMDCVNNMISDEVEFQCYGLVCQ